MSPTRDEMIDRISQGFEAAAKFADCTDDHQEGMSSAEWSEDARATAKIHAAQFLDAVSPDILNKYLSQAIPHQDLGFDNFLNMGTDLYYGLMGHGVGFWSRKELSQDVIDHLGKAVKEAGYSDGPYLGDDGLIYMMPSLAPEPELAPAPGM